MDGTRAKTFSQLGHNSRVLLRPPRMRIFLRNYQFPQGNHVPKLVECFTDEERTP